MDIEEAIKNLKVLIGLEEFNKLSYKENKSIETLLTAYEKEKEKNKELKEKLEKHIKFCEQEAKGSLNNEICHIALKFDKSLLDIINKEE